MKNKVILGFAVVGSLLLLFTPLAQDLVRDVVVIPLLYLAWIGRFIIAAVPQRFLWSCFSILAALVMAGSLLDWRRSRRRQPITARSRHDPLESLTELVQQAEQDDYFQWRLAQRLQKLTFNALSHQTGQSPAEVRRQLQPGASTLPPDLLAYLQASLKPLGSVATTKTRLSRRPASGPLALKPERVVRWLENLLK